MQFFRRRLLFPILMVVIALALTWNARRTATSDATPAAVEAFVRGAVAEGEYGATDAILIEQLRREWPREDIQIEIQPGDGGTGADGSATHRAAISVGGTVRLIVRCRYDADPALRRFVGYSTR